MPEPVESRVILTLALDMTHWRRHDRAHWAQVLAQAADGAAPDLMRVEAYELHDATIVLRMQARRPAKQMWKLWRDDERFLRLKSRFVDLGGQPEIDIEEVGE